MKTAIVCVSVSHGNTRKIANAIAHELDAVILDPEATDPATLDDYDLVGFGSGIFGMEFHPSLRQFIQRLPRTHGKKAFVFATRGGPGGMPFWRYMRRMTRTLDAKGYEVVSTFSCRGYDTWWPLQIVGGLNKGHPDTADVQAAHAFARDVRRRAAVAA